MTKEKREGVNENMKSVMVTNGMAISRKKKKKKKKKKKERKRQRINGMA